jgi:hypothetical protein
MIHSDLGRHAFARHVPRRRTNPCLAQGFAWSLQRESRTAASLYFLNSSNKNTGGKCPSWLRLALLGLRGPLAARQRNDEFYCIPVHSGLRHSLCSNILVLPNVLIGSDCWNVSRTSGRQFTFVLKRGISDLGRTWLFQDRSDLPSEENSRRCEEPTLTGNAAVLVQCTVGVDCAYSR